MTINTGLVLEGGAMRGMYTAGVLDVMMDAGISIDAIVGVSAGALFGVNYLSGQRGRVIRYNKRFNADPDYLGLRPLLREGNIVSTRYAYHDVPRALDPFDDAAYRASGVPFYAVVTDMQTGEPAYMQVHSVLAEMDVLRASGSMPFVSRPVVLGGRPYLDGGIADSIPFEWLAAQGAQRIVVVLTRDAAYRKKPMNPALAKLWYRRYPALVRRMTARHEAYNRAVDLLAQWEREGRALVVRPSEPIEIGRIETDPARLQAVYDLGLRDGEANRARLAAYLRQDL